jgi:hypothetical protein
MAVVAGGTLPLPEAAEEEAKDQGVEEVGIILTIIHKIMAIINQVNQQSALSTRFHTVISQPSYPVHPPWSSS